MKKLGFGLMRLPKDERGEVDLEAVKTMVDAFLASGCTYFDTAAPYHQGNSEIIFREAVVKRYERSAYTVTDKLSLFMMKEKEEMVPFFETQMEKLGVDYLDYYLLHAMDRANYQKAQAFGAFDFIRKLKEEGRVKHLGLSFHDKATVLDEILTAHPEMEYVQLQINYLDWDDVEVEAEKCYAVCRKHGKPVIVMEPIKGGSLANVPEEVEEMYKAENPCLSVASWAMRFAASLENVVTVLSGMSNLEQMQDNIGYMAEFVPLSAREREIVERATAIIKESIKIACTNCRYCVDGCPQKIAIPDHFSLYNELKKRGVSFETTAKKQYRELTEKVGKAGACIGCGKCEKICPQHLPIVKLMKEVDSVLE